MKFMIRDVFTCKRGKVPEYLELLKAVINVMKENGITEHRVFADIAESMDTIFHEYEVDSLDRYFAFERGFFVDMTEDMKQFVDSYNNITVSGRREIFEVLDL